MNQVLSLYNSSTGKKVIMALTGFIGFGFVIIHMLGNLQAFEGPEKLDAYGKLLKSSALILWGARLVLLGAVTVHIMMAFQLTAMSNASRPVGYQRYQPKRSTLASRTMIWGGVTLLLFIIYHLLHFTLGTVHPRFQEGHVYANVVAGFQVPWVSGFYIIAMLALGLHLYHGAWSMFQSLGLNHPKYNPLIRTLATVGTLVVVIGNISVPVAVLTGIIK